MIKSNGCIREDLVGRTFERLTVIEYIGCNKYRTSMYKCVCSCGKEIVTTSSNLKSGHTTSCGCYHRERNAKNMTTHGKSRTRLYRIRGNMISRTSNPNKDNYAQYGGRGIKICDEWANSFQSFYDWAMTNGYEDTLSIDRINSDGDYEPSNCRWVTMKEQNINKTNNLHFEIDGKIKTLVEIAEERNVDYRFLYGRIKRGWDIEKALNTPKDEKFARRKT